MHFTNLLGKKPTSLPVLPRTAQLRPEGNLSVELHRKEGGGLEAATEDGGGHGQGHPQEVRRRRAIHGSYYNMPGPTLEQGTSQTTHMLLDRSVRRTRSSTAPAAAPTTGPSRRASSGSSSWSCRTRASTASSCPPSTSGASPGRPSRRSGPPPSGSVTPSSSRAGPGREGGMGRRVR